jgi:hypothetical protein
MSRGKRSLAAALGRLSVVFALLLAPWPAVGPAWVGVVGSMVTTVMDPLFDSSNVTFRLRSPEPVEHLSEWQGVIDVKQDFPDGPVRHAGAIDLRRAGYLQWVTFLALAAAWPLRRPRSWILAVAIAGAIVGGLIGVAVLDFLSDLGAIHGGSLVAMVLSLSRRALIGAPGMAFAVPGIVWLLLHQGLPRTSPQMRSRETPRSAPTRTRA